MQTAGYSQYFTTLLSGTISSLTAIHLGGFPSWPSFRWYLYEGKKAMHVNLLFTTNRWLREKPMYAYRRYNQKTLAPNVLVLVHDRTAERMRCMRRAIHHISRVCFHVPYSYAISTVRTRICTVYSYSTVRGMSIRT